ncbi:hypothetical protein U1701_13075 [Sphingomonas sp. PB2P19]|uniref:hypothetical protein n=1 Tax=Sphingomonas rhamnosi TaxID=3096156 RepID=UPI002FC92115
MLSNSTSFSGWGGNDGFSQISWVRTSAFHEMKTVGFLLGNGQLSPGDPYELTSYGKVDYRAGALIINGINVPVALTTGTTQFGDEVLLQTSLVPASSFGPYVSLPPATPVGIAILVANVNNTRGCFSTYLTGQSKQKLAGTEDGKGRSFLFPSASNAGYSIANAKAYSSLPVPTGATEVKINGTFFMGLVGEAVAWSQTAASSGMMVADSIGANGIGNYLYGWNTDRPFPGIQTYASSSRGFQWQDNKGVSVLREKLAAYADRIDFEYGANDFHGELGEASLKASLTACVNKLRPKGPRFFYAMQALPRVNNVPILSASVTGTTCTLTVPADVVQRMAVGMTMNVSTYTTIAASVPYAVDNVAISAINIAGNTVSYDKPANTPTAPFTVGGTYGNPTLYNISDNFKSDVFMFPDSADFMPGGARLSYNSTGLDGLIASGVIDGKIDTSAVVHPTRPTMWKSNYTVPGLNGDGVVRYMCGDGTHPNAFAMDAAMSIERSNIATRLGGSSQDLPENIVPPTYTSSGAYEVGQTLTGTNGSWSLNPTAFVYTHRRTNDSGSTFTDIAGSTSISRISSAADAGNQLQFGAKAAGATDYAWSDLTPVIAASAKPLPVFATPPSIATDGSPQAGETVTLVGPTGTFDGYVLNLRREGVNDTATVAAGPYVLKSTDVLTTFELRAVATRDGVSAASVSANIGPIQVAAGGATVAFVDTFVETANKALNAHVPDSGGSWRKAPQFMPDGTTSLWGASGTYAVISGTQELSLSGVTIPHLASVVPTSANFDLETVFIWKSAVVSRWRMIFGLRAEATSKEYYAVEYNYSTKKWGITRTDVAGTATILATTVDTFIPTVGQAYAWKQETRGATTTFFVDGVAVCSVTDAAWSPVGLPVGLYTGTNNGQFKSLFRLTNR